MREGYREKQVREKVKRDKIDERVNLKRKYKEREVRKEKKIKR